MDSYIFTPVAGALVALFAATWAVSFLRRMLGGQ
jgi:hypothetical protein